MAEAASALHPVTRTALTLAPRAGLLLLAGLACLAGTALASGPERLPLATAGTTLAVLALLIRSVVLWHRWRGAGLCRRVQALVALDAAPSIGTDAEGRVEFRNRAAERRFGAPAAGTLDEVMADLFAHPAAVLHRLQNRAAALGAAQEEVATRNGRLHLSVHGIGAGRLLWRFEETRARPGQGDDAISLPMLVAGTSDAVLFANEALRRLLGHRPKSLSQVFPHLPLHSGEETEVAAAGGPLRALVVELAGPGGRREVFLLPAREETGPRVGAAPVAFEDLPVALARIDSSGGLTAANRLARDLLGLAAEEQPVFADLVEGLGRPVGDWLRDAVDGRRAHPEMLRATRVGPERYLQVTLRRAVENGTPGLVAVLNDATELKTLEAQFVQSQKMQAIGQLAGGVAHDFNNLLTAISGHCDLLLLRHEQGDPDYGDLVQIHQNANRAASLVGQLLAFSRKQTLTLETLDLRETLSDLTHLLNRLVGEKVTLNLGHDPDLKAIRADKRQLEQVLMNLVVNARDAMPEGGAIWIETENRTLAAEMQRDRAVVPPGDYVIVRVRDEGTGIPPEAISKIFEPFYTSKRTGEGTGLGLSTAYGIVKQTGGFIFVDSVQGTGTTFSLYFPAHAAPVPAKREVPDAPAPVPVLRQGEGVILLVEDEAPVRAFAARALRLRGYTVLEAENAEAALELLSEATLTVDVIVTDVIMPGRDGPSWVREALETRPDTRVVFISGYAEDSFAEAQARIPNSVFLPKPFSLADLTATVQGQLS